jgi:hypothetical protein
MEIYQVVLVGIAGLIGLSMAWPQIMAMVKGVNNTIPTPEEDFMRIIAGWNTFKRQCEEAGLDDACEKLCEIFPMLIDADGADVPDPDKEINDG